MKMRIWLVLACLSLLISAGLYYRHSAPVGKPQPRQVNIRAQTVSQSLAEQIGRAHV